MDDRAWVATRKGLIELSRRASGWRIARTSFLGEPVSAVLPPDRNAWAAWNAHISATANKQCTVSYCMNILQGVHSPEPFIVSLNQRERIDPAKILAVMHYQHPVFSHDMVRAQQRRHEINGHNRSWFCGAYWGFGFHEDGFRSGHEVAQALTRS
mgnify:CR=1 FL=1